MRSPEEATRATLRSLARRDPIQEADPGTPSRMRSRAPWTVPLGLRIRVLLGWLSLGPELALGALWDLLRGRGGPEARAARLCRGLTRRGPTYARFGQFAARRLELLSPPYQAALGRLKDVAPPMPVELATARAASAAGVDFAEIYAVFDPVPIASTAAACAYQAILTDERKVVVKVRRPEALAAFGAHLFAVGVIAWTLEATSLVRPGSFRQVINELREMATGDLDFRGVARSHRIFRKRARQDRVRAVSAARVHHRLSSDDVTVSEFVSGIRCSEVVAARRSKDLAPMARLHELGVDPQLTARRLLQASWWSFFEGLLFNVETSPAEIVVRPGGRVVYVDLGDCGHTTPANQRLQRRILERMWRNDVGGAAESAVQLLSPMPFIDVYEFKKAIEARLWTQLYAMRDRKAPPQDRTGAGIWLAILECAHDFGVPVRMETVQMMRASAMIDALVADLWPGVNYFREFERYLRRARKRSARRVFRRASKVAGESPVVQILSTAEEVSAAATRLSFWVETATRNPPVDFMAVSKKASYVASVLLRFASILLGLVLVVAVANMAFPSLGAPSDLRALLLAALSNGWFIALVTLLGVAVLRRILFRLDDMDRDD